MLRDRVGLMPHRKGDAMPRRDTRQHVETGGHRPSLNQNEGLLPAKVSQDLSDALAQLPAEPLAATLGYDRDMAECERVATPVGPVV